jgi:CDP-6-deoxy-D-xylo-4-hexulose-3-dehydrase
MGGIADQQYKWRKKNNVESEFQAKYTFHDLGYNFRPTEITGFLGRYQLKFLEDNIKKRENNHIILESIVKKNPELVVIDRTHISVLSGFGFPVLCKSAKIKEKYFTQFSGAGVEIRKGMSQNPMT